MNHLSAHATARLASRVTARAARCARAALAALLAAAGQAHAQDLGIKAPPQARPVLITGATIHPVSAPAIEKGYVLFEGGRITAVGPEPAPRPAGDAEVIDASGRHIYPGLIGAVTQIGLTEIQAVRASRDFNEVGSITPEARAAVSVNPDTTIIPVTRSNGILTVGVFPSGGLVAGQAAALRLDGWTWEELALEQNIGAVVEYPFVRPITEWWSTTPAEEQMKTIQRNLDALDEVFRTAAAYEASRRANPDARADLRWQALGSVLPADLAERRQRPVFINAGDVDQISSAVAWAVGLGLRPVIVGGRDAHLITDLLKQHDVPVIIQGTHNLPKRADSAYDEAFTLPAKLQAADVRWCLAFSDDTAHERNLPYNAATAVAYGLSPDAALHAITLGAAEILGIADRVGSLETGKLATLIITTGDPLDIRSNVTAAFIDGRRIDLSNKQTELARKYRERFRQTGDLRRE
jgi:imidazolonepropionase-like amidohydrolase